MVDTKIQVHINTNHKALNIFHFLFWLTESPNFLNFLERTPDQQSVSPWGFYIQRFNSRISNQIPQ